MPSKATIAKAARLVADGHVQEQTIVRVFKVKQYTVKWYPYSRGAAVMECDCKAGQNDIECSHSLAVQAVIDLEEFK
jgi:hypothetical protein